MNTGKPYFKNRITLLLLSALLAGGPVNLTLADAIRPNVILIMTDDQGYGDFGFTGNPVIKTPHLDALASRSALMTQFYVAPVCAPTRASLMTGRYNFRTRAHSSAPLHFDQRDRRLEQGTHNALQAILGMIYGQSAGQ